MSNQNQSTESNNLKTVQDAILKAWDDPSDENLVAMFRGINSLTKKDLPAMRAWLDDQRDEATRDYYKKTA